MKLGDRMKMYESASQIKLTRRMPLIIRLDGKAFHTFTRGMDKPFDKWLINAMQQTTEYLVNNIQGCKLGYTQSDEINLLLTDYDNFDTEAWFDKKLQKIVSIAASMATAYFNKFDLKNGSIALFDARAFVIPKEEVANYFVWRQQDWTRNSVQMVAQANFPKKSLFGISCNELQNKLLTEKDINWNDFEPYLKRGTCVTINEGIDLNIPIFTEDREYIERFINIDTEEK
jgi:tRNA(His) 5'-end guanylyltransferase